MATGIHTTQIMKPKFRSVTSGVRRRTCEKILSWPPQHNEMITNDVTKLLMRPVFRRKNSLPFFAYRADGATLDDLRAAVTTAEESARIARRVLGGAHPIAKQLDITMLNARAVLRVAARAKH